MKNIGYDEDGVSPFPVNKEDMIYSLLWKIYNNNEKVFKMMIKSGFLIWAGNEIHRIYDTIEEEIIKEIENVPDKPVNPLD